MVEEVILDFRRDFTALWTHKLFNIPQLTAKVPILLCSFVSVKANNWPVVSSKLVHLLFFEEYYIPRGIVFTDNRELWIVARHVTNWRPRCWHIKRQRLWHTINFSGQINLPIRVSLLRSHWL